MSDRVTVSPNVQPLYEHISSADFYQLRRLEQITIPRTPGLDEFEIRLLQKSVALRRRELRATLGGGR